MFSNPFKKKAIPNTEDTKEYIVVQLNARLQPMHRADLFEDPLDEELEKHGIGNICGGGTQLSENREVEYCDVEIEVNNSSDDTVRTIISNLEQLGAPKGSILKIEAEDRHVPFGVCEGMAFYLNGTDLPDDVYEECDSNFVYSEFERLLSGCGRVLSYWQGPTESALYLYGSSFDEMKEKISEFVASYPLCQQSRIEQIA